MSLRCPPGAAGPTWTREAAGKTTTVYSPDEQQTETRAQTRRRLSPEDQTLTVTDLRPDDEGLYYCGGRAAQYLKVTEQSETGETHRHGDGPVVCWYEGRTSRKSSKITDAEGHVCLLK